MSKTVLCFWDIRQAFIDYIKVESNILNLYDFSKDKFGGVFVGFTCCEFSGRTPPMFLSAGLNYGLKGENNLKYMTLSACWVTWNTNQNLIDKFYMEIGKNQRLIKHIFGFQKLKGYAKNTHRFGVEKKNVDLTRREYLDPNFRWLRENLEKLYWIVRIQNIKGW